MDTSSKASTQPYLLGKMEVEKEQKDTDRISVIRKRLTIVVIILWTAGIGTAGIGFVFSLPILLLVSGISFFQYIKRKERAFLWFAFACLIPAIAAGVWVWHIVTYEGNPWK